jgi:hypothetical protein
LCEALTSVCLLIERLDNLLLSFVCGVLLIFLIVKFFMLIDIFYFEFKLYRFRMARLDQKIGGVLVGKINRLLILIIFDYQVSLSVI